MPAAVLHPALMRKGHPWQVHLDTSCSFLELHVYCMQLYSQLQALVQFLPVSACLWHELMLGRQGQDP